MTMDINTQVKEITDLIRAKPHLYSSLYVHGTYSTPSEIWSLMEELGYRKLPEGKPPLLSELEPDVDANFGQEVCCDILPKYTTSVGGVSSECYRQIIGLAYNLAYVIAQIQLGADIKHYEGCKK